MQKISVIMPAYRESGRIAGSIKRTETFLKGLGDYEIIVVDDGSDDGTYEEAMKSAGPNIRVLRYEKNQGKGNALKFGFNHSDGDIVAFVDADMDLPPEQLSAFIEIMEREKADFVVGSKFHPFSEVNYPKRRRFLSFCYQSLIRTFFNLNLSDTQVGMKVMKREPASRIMPALLVKKYAFDLEMLANARRMGYNIAEAPIKLNYNFNSNVGMRSIRNIFVDTCAIFYRMKILRYYDKVDHDESVDNNSMQDNQRLCN